MSGYKIGLLLILVSSTLSSPITSVNEEKAADFEDDPIGYMQDTIADFFDTILSQDNVQVGEDAEIHQNDVQIDEPESRSLNFEDRIERYIKTHYATINLPLIGTVTLGTKNLENDEISLNIKYGETGVEEARKSKLKKILTPILTFVLLKAITVVPLILGILLYKAWNSLQLSVFSFIISSGLAIFQLCRKIAENNAQAQLAAHGPWDEHALKHARNIEDDEQAQDLAYSAYRK